MDRNNSFLAAEDIAPPFEHHFVREAEVTAKRGIDDLYANSGNSLQSAVTELGDLLRICACNLTEQRLGSMPWVISKGENTG